MTITSNAINEACLFIVYKRRKHKYFKGFKNGIQFNEGKMTAAFKYYYARFPNRQ